MAAIVDLLPPEAKVQIDPTEDQLRRTYPKGKIADTDETARRPGTD